MRARTRRTSLSCAVSRPSAFGPPQVPVCTMCGVPPRAHGRLWPAARMGAVPERVPGRVGQDRIQLRRIVDVGGRDRHAPDQPGVLIGRDMRLVAMGGLAPPVPGPACLPCRTDARRWDRRRHPVQRRAATQLGVARRQTALPNLPRAITDLTSIDLTPTQDNMEADRTASDQATRTQAS